MGLRLGWWVIDALDDELLPRFYEELLGWPRLFTDASGVALVPELPPVLGRGFLLYTDHTTGPKRFKNRAHVDLRPADQDALVARALGLGATHADIGQGEPSWVVLADPEGNELCILSSDAVEGDAQVDAWTLDANDMGRIGEFWAGLLGWDEVDRDEDSIRLRDPAGEAHDLLIQEVPDPKRDKNRIHPDLIPDGEPGDPDAISGEVARALDLGATAADIGQGEVSWSVMADPEGNEFCILRPPPADLAAD